MWWSSDNDISSYMMLILWSSEDHLMIMGKFWWLFDYHVLNICWSSLVYLMITQRRFIIWQTSDDNIRIAYWSFVDYDMIIQRSFDVQPKMISWLSDDHLLTFSWLSYYNRMVICWLCENHQNIMWWSYEDYLMIICSLSEYLMIVW